MTPHATPALAQQLRSLAASAPALVAAADAVEECARLRAERDKAKRAFAACSTMQESMRSERDEALKANAIFKKREAENMEREFVLEQQRDEALRKLSALNRFDCAIDMAVGDAPCGVCVICLKKECDAARQLLTEAYERIVSLHGCFPPDHKRGSEAEKSNRVLGRINNLLMQEVVK